jgi:hypothetical protein
VVSNANSDKQFDADMEQGKADTFRARDIIPPYTNITRREPDSQQTGEDKPHPPAVPKTSVEQELGGENVREVRSEQIKPVEDVPAAPTKTEQQKSEIPRFDLAEKIMVKQRRITAISRKAPGQRDEAQSQQPKVESIGYTIGPSPALSEQEHIIAEIVARDIEKFLQGRHFKRP